jgi:hypothetical protein
MDRADLDQALYARMRWNTPLSAEDAALPGCGEHNPPDFDKYIS